jgi:hypothetical protein
VPRVDHADAVLLLVERVECPVELRPRQREDRIDPLALQGLYQGLPTSQLRRAPSPIHVTVSIPTIIAEPATTRAMG